MRTLGISIVLALVAAVVVMLIGGLRYFRKTESTFADIV